MILFLVYFFVQSINHLFVKASNMTVTKVSVQDQQGSESAYSDPKTKPKYVVYFSLISVRAWGEHYCLQCFDAVGWAAGRASGL